MCSIKQQLSFIFVFLLYINFAVGAFVNDTLERGATSGGGGKGSNRKCKLPSVRLYRKDFYDGYTLDDAILFFPNPTGMCTPVPETFAGQIRSIDPFDNTVILWNNNDCTGYGVRLSRYSHGTADLTLVSSRSCHHTRRYCGFRSMQLASGVDKPDLQAVC